MSLVKALLVKGGDQKYVALLFVRPKFFHVCFKSQERRQNIFSVLRQKEKEKQNETAGRRAESHNISLKYALCSK